MIGLIIIIGAFLNFSASPAVANRIGVGSFHFIKRQFFFLPLAVGIMLLLSMQSLKTIRRTAVIGYVLTVVLMILALWGPEVKGAHRWIALGYFSLQPSEFVKPTFVVVAAWLFEGQKRYRDFPGDILSIVLFAFTLFLLLLQPDVGMSVVVTLVWAFQFFLSGLSLWIVGGMALAGVLALGGAYLVFPHVQARFQQFLASENNLSYQVKKAMEAFENGKAYYAKPIEHFGGTQTDDKTGEIGVVRNHSYQITVTQVSGLGEGVFDPEEDIKPTDTKKTYYVGAELNILSWKTVSQDVSFGN